MAIDLFVTLRGNDGCLVGVWAPTLGQRSVIALTCIMQRHLSCVPVARWYMGCPLRRATQSTNQLSWSHVPVVITVRRQAGIWTSILGRWETVHELVATFAVLVWQHLISIHANWGDPLVQLNVFTVNIVAHTGTQLTGWELGCSIREFVPPFERTNSQIEGRVGLSAA